MIRVECDPDYMLVRTLTNFSKRYIIHHGGKFEICKALKNSENSKGVIDEDPGYPQPKYIEKLVISEDLPALNLKVFNDEIRNNVELCINCFMSKIRRMDNKSRRFMQNEYGK
ncbi:MAG: hypothetical protein ACTSRL_08540 [Candidatus Helarchaeota archaeon]